MLPLPTPNADEIGRYQKLFREQTGEEISLGEAGKSLSALVQLAYLLDQHRMPADGWDPAMDDAGEGE